MRKVVITGITGFLGSHLAKLYLDQGDQVYGLVRPSSIHKNSLPVHSRFQVVPCELSHVLDCVSVIEQADVFYHFAWGGVNREEIDSPLVQQENIEGSLDCIKAANLLQCKIFMDAGSRVEYGVTDQVMREDLPCNPVNEYGKAKLAFYHQATTLCEDYQIKYCHLRFFSVYGLGDHPWSIISTLVRDLKNNQNVSLSACTHEWNFMYIEDAVRAVSQVCDYMEKHPWNQGEIINIASQETKVLKEFAMIVKQLIGGNGQLEFGTFIQAKEGAVRVCPDAKKLRDMIGFQEDYGFMDGISQMIKKEVEQEDEKN